MPNWHYWIITWDSIVYSSSPVFLLPQPLLFLILLFQPIQFILHPFLLIVLTLILQFMLSPFFHPILLIRVLCSLLTVYMLGQKVDRCVLEVDVQCSPQRRAPEWHQCWEIPITSSGIHTSLIVNISLNHSTSTPAIQLLVKSIILLRQYIYIYIIHTLIFYFIF